MKPHTHLNIDRKATEAGFVSVLILFVAAALATFSYGLINIGDTAIKVNMEKQMLDTHGILVGQSAIKHGLGQTCSEGFFIGEMAERSEELFNNLEGIEADDRQYTCEPIGGLIERGEGDPDGPPGTFRRYRVRSTLNAQIFDDQEDDEGGVSRDVIVEVRELSEEVERPRPQVMFLLDYSGSMGGERVIQLRNAVSTFVNANYELDYGIVIYDSNVRTQIGINSGANHNQSVLSMINNQAPAGSTNFGDPLLVGINALEARVQNEVFIVLISDGNPNAGPNALTIVENQIRSVDPQSCLTHEGEKCITVYTLGVDNANVGLLQNLSGNAITNPNDRDDFTFIANAAGTQGAFSAIVEDILCRVGPIDPAPGPDEQNTINVLVDENPLEIGVDFVYDGSTNSIKLFDEAPNFACTSVLDQGGSVTVRYGQPRLIVSP